MSYPRTFLTSLTVFDIKERRERGRIVKLGIHFLKYNVNGWAMRTFPNVLFEVFSCAYVSYFTMWTVRLCVHLHMYCYMNRPAMCTFPDVLCELLCYTYISWCTVWTVMLYVHFLTYCVNCYAIRTFPDVLCELLCYTYISWSTLLITNPYCFAQTSLV
jgi:hypothetical protein